MCPAALPGAPAPHERGAAFSLERRLGDAWILEAYLVSHRDPEGPWVIFPDEMDPLPELLIDDPDPDRLVLPDAVRAALHRVCEIYDPERCAHLDIQP